MSSPVSTTPSSPSMSSAPPASVGATAAAAAAAAAARKQKRGRQNVTRACLACRKSHLACDFGRPCRRCLQKGICCVEDTSVRKRGPKSHKTGASHKHHHPAVMTFSYLSPDDVAPLMSISPTSSMSASMMVSSLAPKQQLLQQRPAERPPRRAAAAVAASVAAELARDLSRSSPTQFHHLVEDSHSDCESSASSSSSYSASHGGRSSSTTATSTTTTTTTANASFLSPPPTAPSASFAFELLLSAAQAVKSPVRPLPPAAVSAAAAGLTVAVPSRSAARSLYAPLMENTTCRLPPLPSPQARLAPLSIYDVVPPTLAWQQ